MTKYSKSIVIKSHAFLCLGLLGMTAFSASAPGVLAGYTIATSLGWSMGKKIFNKLFRTNFDNANLLVDLNKAHNKLLLKGIANKVEVIARDKMAQLGVSVSEENMNVLVKHFLNIHFTDKISWEEIFSSLESCKSLVSTQRIEGAVNDTLNDPTQIERACTIVSQSMREFLINNGWPLSYKMCIPDIDISNRFIAASYDNNCFILQENVIERLKVDTAILSTENRFAALSFLITDSIFARKNKNQTHHLESSSFIITLERVRFSDKKESMTGIQKLNPNLDKFIANNKTESLTVLANFIIAYSKWAEVSKECLSWARQQSQAVAQRELINEALGVNVTGNCSESVGKTKKHLKI